MASVTAASMRKYINSGLNVLLQGMHGTGKTSIVMQACEQEGVKFAYFSASTLDPHMNLIGVPKFVTDATGTEHLKCIRPHTIDEAEVIMFDELNRADPAVTNAVFEIIQFGTINGENLPNLKCVIAAQNPPGEEHGYDVQSLDPALVDRFHLVFDVVAKPSTSYLSTKFPRPMAKALVKWYNDRDATRTEYISPRRLEMIGHVYVATRDRAAVSASFPPEGKYDSGKLFTMLEESEMTDAERQKAQDKRDKQMTTGVRVVDSGTVSPLDEFREIFRNAANDAMLNRELRKRPAAWLKDVGENLALTDAESDRLIDAFAGAVSPERLVTQFGDFFFSLSDAGIVRLTAGWRNPKMHKLRGGYLYGNVGNAVLTVEQRRVLTGWFRRGAIV